jgi:hypothetical protein
MAGSIECVAQTSPSRAGPPGGACASEIFVTGARFRIAAACAAASGGDIAATAVSTPASAISDGAIDASDGASDATLLAHPPSTDGCGFVAGGPGVQEAMIIAPQPPAMALNHRTRGCRSNERIPSL